MGTSIISGSPTGTTDVVNTSVNKISSKEFQADKNGILECTKKNIKNLVGSCLMAGALIAGGTSARAEAPQNPVALLQASGFSGPSAEGVLALSNFVREKQASGGLAPTEAVSITTVVPLSPDGKGLDQLVNTGSKLPKKTFAEVAKTSSLTAENYNAVVEALFDPTDLEIWLTRADGSQMSEQEKADYRTMNEGTKKRWLAKLPEFVKAGKQDVITRWFELFNALAAKPIHGSREEYRRGLIAANSMANYSTISADKKEIFSPLTATGAAEYVLIVDPKAKLIKIERTINLPGKAPSSLKYLVADDASLIRAGFKEGSTANDLAFAYWNKDQRQIYDLQAKVLGAKAELSGAKAELSGAKAELSGAKAELSGAQAKLSGAEAKLAETTKAASVVREFKDLQDITLSLSKTIQEQFDQLQSRRGDREFILALNSNLQSWKALKVKVDKIITSEDGMRFIIKDNRDTIASLLNKVLENARANGLA